MRPTDAAKAALLALSLLVAGSAGAQDAAPAIAAPAPRIGVMTMLPGTEFWERFGHDSLVVVDPVSGHATSYNYGFFDLSEPGFVGNFIRGKMRYQLVALPLDEDLANYEAVGRGVGMQWLDLDPAQATALAQALAINARPENARYTYDYFLSNCATRVRDRVDEALDGGLQRQLAGRSQGNTYRSESVRLAWPAKWMAFGFHLGMSGAGDQPLSRWQEAFVPMRLRDSLREVKRADGRPLVSQEVELLPSRLPAPPSETPRWRVPATIAGLALALGILWLGKRRPRLVAGLALPFWLIGGLLGATMLFLWLGSAHVFGHRNENLLLLSPLLWLLLPGGWRMARGRGLSPSFRALLWSVAGLAAVAGFLKFLPFMRQENVEWVLLLLPVHWALARALDPVRNRTAAQ
jgi:Domain of unknown function (DUF4105)